MARHESCRLLLCCQDPQVLLSICRNLSGKELQRLALTCSTLYNCICMKPCDSLWAHLCLLDFGIIPPSQLPLSPIASVSESAALGESSAPCSTNKGLIAFNTTPRVACTPFYRLSPVAEGFRVRMVRIVALPKGQASWRDVPDSTTAKIIVQTLIEKWYAAAEINVNKVLCWYYNPTWSALLLFEMENEEYTDAFHQWIGENLGLLEPFSSDLWSLVLCEKRHEYLQMHGMLRQAVDQNRYPIYCSETVLSRSPLKWNRVYTNLSIISSTSPGRELFAKCEKKNPKKPSRKPTKLGQRRQPGPWASFLAVIGIAGSGKRTLVGKLCQMFPYNSYTCHYYMEYKEDQNLSVFYMPESDHAFFTGIYDLNGTPSPGDLNNFLPHVNAVLFVVDCLTPESSIPLLTETLKTLSSHRDIPLVVANHRYDLAPNHDGITHIAELMASTAHSSDTSTAFKPPHNWAACCTSVFAPQSLTNLVDWLSVRSPKFDYSHISKIVCSML
ncbi:hypothetical protein Pelo_9002 [Pelomyxa schiedti]|nr:hypothetical protein Pelo_9002 [Pelomyxa schiedti]